MKKRRVLIIDRSELSYDSLSENAERTCTRAMGDLLALEPDIIIIDTGTSGDDLSDSIARLRTENPRIRIITLERPTDSGTARTFNGNSGSCLVAEAGIESIIASIEETYSGDVVLSPSMALKLGKELLQPKIPEHLRKAARQYDLNPREIEVLQMLIRGATITDMARSLSLTEITIKAHLNRIFDKLHVVNRYQAASVVIEKSIISDHG